MKRRFGRPLPRVSQVPSSRTITFQPRSSSPGEVPVSSSSADRILPGTCSSIVDPSIRGGMNVFSAASGSSRIRETGIGHGVVPDQPVDPAVRAERQHRRIGVAQHDVDPERRPAIVGYVQRAIELEGPQGGGVQFHDLGAGRDEVGSVGAVARARTDAGTRTRVAHGIGRGQHER